MTYSEQGLIIDTQYFFKIKNKLKEWWNYLFDISDFKKSKLYEGYFTGYTYLYNELGEVVSIIRADVISITSLKKFSNNIYFPTQEAAEFFLGEFQLDIFIWRNTYESLTRGL